MIPWREAWREALYGTEGFYRRPEGPLGHFATSAHGPLGAVLVEALAALVDLGGLRGVVDVGAGRGELLAHLHRLRPDLRLTGVEVVDRPAGLPGPVSWLRSPGGPALPDSLQELSGVLVVAHEWLDVVPCTVAEVLPGGRPAVVLVDPLTGEESVADPGSDSLAGRSPAQPTPVRLTPAELAWCAQHWPTSEQPPGARVEVGAARDAAWAGLLSRIRSGVVLAVDYGHTGATRPERGTLAAYREGRQVTPVPDGSCDLTAHVAVDSLEHDEVLTQREALGRLGLRAGRPPRELARTDPAAYLAALSRRSSLAELTDPDGAGSFHWVLRRVER